MSKEDASRMYFDQRDKRERKGQFPSIHELSVLPKCRWANKGRPCAYPKVIRGKTLTCMVLMRCKSMSHSMRPTRSGNAGSGDICIRDDFANLLYQPIFAHLLVWLPLSSFGYSSQLIFCSARCACHLKSCALTVLQVRLQVSDGYDVTKWVNPLSCGTDDYHGA